ncbi:MAG TPA: dCMP deaminase family protein [Candidatus Pacearchaeota archaeon]|nr:dCMP deaminase family protein [Candidatus Pacearchaeota archaeon]
MDQEKSRPSKDVYYLDIAQQVGERSTCYRSHGGAIIVRDDQIIATGYIGAPRKTKDCYERGNCLRELMRIPHGTRYEICRSVHAEMNAIINSARAGVSLLNGDIYLSIKGKDGKFIDSLPCFFCKRMIINAGIRRLIGRMSDGGYKVFNVEDWINDWREKDISDDKHQYGSDMNKKENMQL